MRRIIPCFGLVAAIALCAPAALALPTPISPDESRFMEVAAPIKAKSGMPTTVAKVAESFLGRPYAEHMLDAVDEAADGSEPLVARLDAFDCVTLVETSVAIARSLNGTSPSYASFQQELEKLRYRGGKRGGYATRLHYFSEWIADNERRGLVMDLTPSLGGEADRRPLRFMTSHRTAYRKLADERTFAAVKAAENDLASSTRYVIPKERLEAVLPMLMSGDIVAIATNIEGLDVVHTGLIYRKKDGTVHLLHAPQPGQPVTISSKPLTEYLQTFKVHTGVMVARPLAPGSKAD